MRIQDVSDARKEDVLFLYDMGEYVPRIAERVGLGLETTKQTLRRFGRDPNRSRTGNRIPNYQTMRHLGGSKWLIDDYPVQQQTSRRWLLTKKDGTTVGFSSLTEAQEWVAIQ